MNGPSIAALVVDPDARSLRRMRELLRSKQLDVFTADNMRQAIGLLRETQFSMLFTELRLPDGDGISLICAARKARPNLATVIVTGNCSVESSIEALRNRAADFLLKPVSEAMIDAALSRIAKFGRCAALYGTRSRRSIVQRLAGK